jgi:hypothetical protein
LEEDWRRVEGYVGRFSQMFTDFCELSWIVIDFRRFSEMFIDFHGFSQMFIRQAFNMDEKSEKQCFMLIAFLPPYLRFKLSRASEKIDFEEIH